MPAAFEILLTELTDALRPLVYAAEEEPVGSGLVRLALEAGYDLEGAGTADVVGNKTTKADLTVRKAQDLASQLSNAEWIESVPGTPAEKASLRPCARHCPARRCSGVTCLRRPSSRRTRFCRRSGSSSGRAR